MTNFYEQGLAVAGFGVNVHDIGDYLQWTGVKRDFPLNPDFHWSPSTNVSQACGSINLTVPETNINTNITFTVSQHHSTIYVPNPSFEKDTVGQSPAGWTPYTTSTGVVPTATVTTAWATDGMNSVLVSGSTGGSGYDAGIETGFISILPNFDYVFGADFKVNATWTSGTELFFGVSWYTSSHTLISQYLANSDMTGDGMATLAYGETSPSNAAYAVLQAFFTNPGANVTESFYMDNVFFSPAEDSHYIQAVKFDFGDGSTGFYDNYQQSFGGEIVHQFTVANFQNIVTMIAIDNFGNEYVVSHPNYLV